MPPNDWRQRHRGYKPSQASSPVALLTLPPSHPMHIPVLMIELGLYTMPWETYDNQPLEGRRGTVTLSNFCFRAGISSISVRWLVSFVSYTNSDKPDHMNHQGFPESAAHQLCTATQSQNLPGRNLGTWISNLTVSPLGTVTETFTLIGTPHCAPLPCKSKTFHNKAIWFNLFIHPLTE